MKILISGMILILLAGCSSVTTQPQGIQVSVSGWVKNPGDYSLRAHATVVEALEAAGGFKDVGHSSTLTIVRTTDGHERASSLRLHYVAGKPQSDFELLNGDKVYAREALR